MADKRNPLVNESDPTAGLAPNLTTDEPGSVGDAIPPISADLEQAGGVDEEQNRVDPFGSGGTAATISGAPRVSSGNQARPEPFPPTPAHFADAPADAALPKTGEPYPEEPGPVGRATPLDLPAMAGAPSSNEAVRPAVAVPGKPDGEVDTRT